MDDLIDQYMKSRGRAYFPHKLVRQILPLISPGTTEEGRGAYKTVYKIKSRNARRILVLKAGAVSSVERDMAAYHQLSPRIRNRYFAKIYWHTKYFVLQKYGEKESVPIDTIKTLKVKTGLRDVRVANIRKVDGIFKIVDANPRLR